MTLRPGRARPEHLQSLKSHPAFRAIGSDRTVGAVRALLSDQPWENPKDWGAFFLQFPVGSEWTVPDSGWHLDGNYTGRLAPPSAGPVHARGCPLAHRVPGCTAAGDREHRLCRRCDHHALAAAACRSAVRPSGEAAALRGQQGLPRALLVSRVQVTLSWVWVSKSLASWRSCNWLEGSP